MKLRLLFPLLLFSSLAFAQGFRYDSQVFGSRGPIPGAIIAVCTQPANTSTTPCSPLATLYTDSTVSTACNGSNGCSNPITADVLGNFHFYYKTANVPFTFQVYGPQVATPYIIADQIGTTFPGSVSTLTVGSGTFSATPSYTAGNANTINSVLAGSNGAPVTWGSASFISQKFTNVAGGTANVGAYFGAVKQNAAANSSLTSLFSECQDTGGTAGSFCEGFRGMGYISATGGSGFGVVGVGLGNTSVAYGNVIGVEGESDNNNVDAPASLNAASFAASFVASSGGSKRSDVAFIVNPFNGAAAAPRRGFYVPLNSIFTSGTAIQIDAQATFGIDMNGATITTPIRFPNGSTVTSVVSYAPTLAPTAVAAQTCSDQTFTVNGLDPADRITDLKFGASVGSLSFSAGANANSLVMHICNVTGGSLTPPNTTYSFIAIR